MNTRGEVIGGHSTVTNGVKVIIFNPNNPGRFLNKNQTSTMFPVSWNAERLKFEVNAAYQNKVVIHTPTWSMWKGTTSSGVKVTVYITPKVTVYPMYK